jgi:glycosyltransferase involved in cell wall biosynthesis
MELATSIIVMSALIGTTVSSCDAPPRVSVIIPSYNRADFLMEALESVFHQTWKNFEVIVIDDGSTDDTATRIEPWLSRIRFLSQPNSGVAAARNLGIRYAGGEFICFLDSDDLWVPTKLEEQIAFADRNDQYALIATELDSFDSAGRVSFRVKSSMYHIPNGFVLEHLLFSNWIQTSTVMVRRQAVVRAGGFDEDVGQFGEDWLLWMRIAAEAPIYFLPIPMVRYRVHAQNLSSHRPASQYKSLMCILDRLALLPQFQARRKLLRRARYRIAFGRGLGDLRTSSYESAIDKFRTACAVGPFPNRALVFLLWARVMRRVSSRTAIRMHL